MKEKLHILKQQWTELLQNPEHQKIRIKDAADILKVSEAELLSTTINSKSKFLNIPNWQKFFKEVTSLGPMMYLVRNNYAVHENTTIINHIECQTHNNTQYLIISGIHSIIKINSSLIKYAFYTKAMARGNEIYSIQLFNDNGIAVIKIYLKNNNLENFNAIKDKYEIQYNYELQKLKNVNNKILNNDYPLGFLLKEKFSLQEYLEIAVQNNYKLKIKIKNKVTTSIYKGGIHNVLHKFNWLNIMDENFNLHVKDEKINKIFVEENNNVIKCYHNSEHILDISQL